MIDRPTFYDGKFFEKKEMSNYFKNTEKSQERRVVLSAVKPRPDLFREECFDRVVKKYDLVS